MAAERSRSRALDALTAHPVFDQLIPVVATAAWLRFGGSLIPAEPGTRVSFYVGVATVSALVLAAATFVCTMTYQSTSALMSDVRRHFGRQLTRNWTSIIVAALVTSVVPILMILLDGKATTAAMAVSIYCVALLTVRFGRSVYWLSFTLFMDNAQMQVPEPYVVPSPISRSSRISS
jgi:uncharacterized membrane protein